MSFELLEDRQQKLLQNVDDSTNNIFRDSSAVEQLPVKQLVVGSIPTRGAHKILAHLKRWSLILVLRERKLNCFIFR